MIARLEADQGLVLSAWFAQASDDSHLVHLFSLVRGGADAFPPGFAADGILRCHDRGRGGLLEGLAKAAEGGAFSWKALAPEGVSLEGRSAGPGGCVLSLRSGGAAVELAAPRPALASFVAELRAAHQELSERVDL